MSIEFEKLFSLSVNNVNNEILVSKNVGLRFPPAGLGDLNSVDVTCILHGPRTCGSGAPKLNNRWHGS